MTEPDEPTGEDGARTISERYPWLFRPEDEPSTAPVPATEEAQTTSVRAVASAPVVPEPDEPDEGPGRRVGLVIALAVVLVLMLAVGALVLTRSFGRGLASGTSPAVSVTPILSPSTSSPEPTESPAPTPSESGAFPGPVTPVRATEIAADCTAPDAVDDAGTTVRYDARLAEDGDYSTAWRCDGDGVGRQLAFTLPAGTTVAQLGLVNGYAKTDPHSDKDRYGEYRRITRVTWTLQGGQTFTQDLRDDVEAPQTFRIPVVDCEHLTMRIDTTTAPGSTSRLRDAVLISEVAIGTPQ